MSGGPVSLVTGSARGLGLAVARHLRARGDRVHAVYRSANARAEALRAEFGAAAHRADLLQPADAEVACRTAIHVDPETAAAHYFLWDALEAQSKHEALEDAARVVLTMQPDHADAHARIARSRAARGLA